MKRLRMKASNKLLIIAGIVCLALLIILLLLFRLPSSGGLAVGTAILR